MNEYDAAMSPLDIPIFNAGCSYAQIMEFSENSKKITYTEFHCQRIIFEICTFCILKSFVFDYYLKDPHIFLHYPIQVFSVLG